MGLNAIGLGHCHAGRQARACPSASWSATITAPIRRPMKQALINGLLAGGAEVHDIGLALSPMAYFAQFALEVEGVAMVTASHNDNGWTGIKMGMKRPLTFGPEEMTRAEGDRARRRRRRSTGGGSLHLRARHRRALHRRPDQPAQLKRRLKVVAACGNGTAGAFAPQVLEALGCEVVPLDCDLDYTFPRYNPNPEDMKMLHAMRERCWSTGADVGLGFDGDGDRCGVVDNEGHEIFADKVGVMLARDLSARHPEREVRRRREIDRPVHHRPRAAKNGARAAYWKTGHSYMKRYTPSSRSALVGFEKSGHFFFHPPLGRGYDDGLVSAHRRVRHARRATPARRWPTSIARCPRPGARPPCRRTATTRRNMAWSSSVIAHFKDARRTRREAAGQNIRDLITVNGVRVMLEDGTWGLVRASSNKPELVVVVESPTSEANMRAIFAEH